ncbi:MAG: oxidoreductase [Rhodospirillaceae bacterium]|nr:oxidoreductase [Rhodospirillaceae bacterium]|tara:strand:+ start:159 stop:1724 length:1566 start_codon:yes stop_codon:yes gene_type:complete
MTETSPAAPPTVAVIGCGHWGKNHVRNFHALGALAAVSDANPDLAAKMAETYEVPAKAVAEILADAGITGVVIAAPAEAHADLAIAALEAGKHVFVEKPLALTLAEADGVLAAAEKAGCILMVGHLLQYHPAFLKLVEMVRAGELGKLQYLYSNRLNLGKIRREENALWSFAPHDISMILALVGDEPKVVRAEGGSYLHEVIADVTTTHLTFPGGEQAHVFVSWLHPFKEQKLVVVGEQAMAVFNDGEPWDKKLVVYPHKIDWRDGVPTPEKADAQPVALAESEPLRDECRHFLDCMATGTTPRTDGVEGRRVLSVLERAEADMSKTRDAGRFPGATVHETAVVDDGATIGGGSKIWHFSHVLPGTAIGANVVVGQNASIGPDVTIGDNCKIQNNVSVYKGVTLAEGVFCGPSCVFTNVLTPRAEVNRKEEFLKTPVGRGATIGANATVVCGHALGAYCMIAAGAVVTKDVPAHALMAGVPAKRIGWVSHAGERLGDDLICPREGRKYKVSETGNLEELKT